MKIKGTTFLVGLAAFVPLLVFFGWLLADLTTGHHHSEATHLEEMLK